MSARPGRPELINSGYGRAALAELHRLVQAAKKSDPLAPVTVLVPSNNVGVAARRWLASEPPGVGNVAFTTVHRLAESLGAPLLAAQKRRPVSPPIVLAALRYELARDAGVLAPVGDHPATEEALLRVDRELTGMTAAGLQRLSSLSPRAADVVRLHRATRARLAKDWYDEADLLVAASDHVASLARLDKRFGPLIIFLPQRLSPRARRFLASLADAVATTVVVAMTNIEAADRDVTDLLQALSLPNGLSMPAPLHAVTEVVAADSDDEVRVAIRHVLDALQQGTPLDRCAIVYPNPDPYGALVADRLDEAGLAWNGPDGRDLSDTVLGHAALSFVGLARSDLRRADVFAVLAAVPARSAGRPVPVALWERLSRQAGIVGGRHEWGPLLAAAQERLRYRADGLAEQGDDYGAQRLRSEADRITPFASFIDDLFRRLDRLSALSSWSKGIGVLHQLIHHVLGTESLRDAWPVAEQRSADEVEGVLDQLAHLDPVDPSPTIVHIERALTHALTTASLRRGRRGTGMVVGPLAEALGLDLDLVVIVGAAEGIMPAVQGDDPVLPDRERRQTRELDLSATRPWQQQREFLAAAAAAGHGQLVVSWPQGDLRQRTERRRSRWIEPLLAPHARTEVGPFTQSLRQAITLGTEHEARLQAVAAGAPPSPDDINYQRAAAAVHARTSDTFTPFDGYVGAEVASVLQLGQAALSPTHLQAWASCPHAYFVRYVLGVGEVDDPADELALTPLDEGNLVHAVLDRFVTGTLDDAEFTSWSAPEERARLRVIFNEEADQVEQRGRSGRAVYWRYDRERVWGNLVAFVTADAERLEAQHARPVGSEVRFGGPGQPAAVLRLPSGRELSFRGSIDRVDLTRFGHLEVTDYKTGSSFSYAKLNAESPDDHGTHLQLPIYALAAANAFAPREGVQVQSHFRFISNTATKPEVGYPVDEDLLSRFGADVEVIVDGIEQGLFPNHPQATTRTGFVLCAYCDPDGMGVTELDRAWSRKQTADVLAGYRRLLGASDDDESADE